MTQPTPRDPTLILGLLLAAAAFVLRLRPLGSPDIWWHLHSGRAVLAEKALRFPDHVAIPFGKEFVADEWAFDVLAWGLWSAGGPNALLVFAALAAAVSFLLVWALARDVAPDRPWTTLAIAAAVLAATSVRFFPRPHVLFLCLLPATLLLTRLAVRAEGTRRRLLLGSLVALALFWAQVHPSVIIVAACVACMGLPLVLGRRRPGEPRWRLGRDLWVTLLLLALAPLTTAHGLDLIGHVAGHSGADSTRHIGEMAPLAWGDFWPPTSRTLLIVELLLAAAALGAAHARRLPLGPLALALLGLALTLSTHRFRAAWAILLVPLVADVVRPRWEDRRWLLVVAGVLLASLLTAGRGWTGRMGLDPAWVPTALGEAADHFDLRGDVFNDYDSGGYLGQHRWGALRVWIDGRTPSYYPDDRFWAARQAIDDPAVFERLDGQYAFSAAVVPRDSALCSALAQSDRFAPVWFDGDRSLFLRGDHPERLHHLAPCATESNVLRCLRGGTVDVYLAEIEGLLKVSPHSSFLARLAELMFSRCGSGFDTPIALIEPGLAQDPDHPDLPWILAQREVAAGDQAAAASRLASSDSARARQMLARMRAASQDGPGARAAIEPVVLDQGDAASAELLGLLAEACRLERDTPCSLHFSLRAALRGDPRGRAVLQALAAERRVPPELLDLSRAALRD